MRSLPKKFFLNCLAGLLVFCPSATQAKPLKIFILAGQSNMQGHAAVRTFDHLAMDPATVPLLAEMRGADGDPRVLDDVWISSLGSSDEVRTGKLTAGFGAGGREPKIGPEFTFGIFMGKRLGEPVLIIKTSWGGKSLHTDFRPPSGGPYPFSEAETDRIAKQGKDLETIKAEKATATGHFYRLMIEHVRKVLGNIPAVCPDYDPASGHQLAGFVWFQGWNDMVDGGVYPDREKPGGYDNYSTLLAQFIRDVRKDLSAPEMPFVIGVMGVGGPTADYLADEKRYTIVHQRFRDAMAAPAALPEFKGNVVNVLTEQSWDPQLTLLRSKQSQVSQKEHELKKEGKLNPAEQKAAVEVFRAEALTPEETEIIEKGVSNAEYHYLGSAKIIARIGKAFADAMPTPP